MAGKGLAFTCGSILELQQAKLPFNGLIRWSEPQKKIRCGFMCFGHLCVQEANREEEAKRRTEQSALN